MYIIDSNGIEERFECDIDAQLHRHQLLKIGLPSTVSYINDGEEYLIADEFDYDVFQYDQYPGGRLN